MAGLIPPKDRKSEDKGPVREGGSDNKIWRRMTISRSGATTSAYSRGKRDVVV